MTDKDDDRQIQDDQQPADTAPEADVEVELEDVDDIALAEARAAVEAEEAGDAGKDDDDQPKAGEDPPEDPDKAAVETPPAEPEKDGDDKPAEGPPANDNQPAPMIPKARFDEVNTENARLREQNAYFKGLADARQTQPAGDTPAVAPPKSPEDRIAELRQQKVAFAQKFDDGEKTFAEVTAETDKLNDQEHAIREEQLRGNQTPAQPGTSGNELYLEEKTRDLESQHPYAKEIKSQDDWDFITKKAMAEFHAEGVTLPDDARGDLMLRERMATLTDRYGPMLTGKDLSKPSDDGKPETPGGPSGLADARKDKLALADKHPPDLSTSGAPGTPTEYTDEKIAGMSEDDIGELPQSVRDRLAGR